MSQQSTFTPVRMYHAGRHYVRRGFTLAEVLVTLAIVAIMAAVLLPALNQQISKGETGRLASDLTNIQTAAQAFLSDVHRYPGTLSQLTTAVGTTDINGATIPTALQTKWKGPYISRDAVATTGGGGTFASSFSIVTSNSIPYLTVNVSPITTADFSNIEAVLDEGTTSTTSSSAGNVRYSTSNSTLSFLALPIQ